MSRPTACATQSSQLGPSGVESPQMVGAVPLVGWRQTARVARWRVKDMLLWRIVRRLLALGIRFAIVNRGVVLALVALAALALVIVSTGLPGPGSPAETQGKDNAVTATASITPVPTQAVALERSIARPPRLSATAVGWKLTRW